LLARLDFFERRFFDAAPEIEPKDPQRVFRMSRVLRLSDGTAALVSSSYGAMESGDLGPWHADHKVPHSKRGKTIVANGQVACPDCNFAKSGGASTASAAE
jgi:HNH endonuclease